MLLHLRSVLYSSVLLMIVQLHDNDINVAARTISNNFSTSNRNEQQQASSFSSMSSSKHNSHTSSMHKSNFGHGKFGGKSRFWESFERRQAENDADFEREHEEFEKRVREMEEESKKLQQEWDEARKKEEREMEKREEEECEKQRQLTVGRESTVVWTQESGMETCRLKFGDGLSYQESRSNANLKWSCYEAECEAKKESVLYNKFQNTVKHKEEPYRVK